METDLVMCCSISCFRYRSLLCHMAGVYGFYKPDNGSPPALYPLVYMGFYENAGQQFNIQIQLSGADCETSSCLFLWFGLRMKRLHPLKIIIMMNGLLLHGDGTQKMHLLIQLHGCGE